MHIYIYIYIYIILLLFKVATKASQVIEHGSSDLQLLLSSFEVFDGIGLGQLTALHARAIHRPPACRGAPGCEEGCANHQGTE